MRSIGDKDNQLRKGLLEMRHSNNGLERKVWNRYDGAFLPWRGLQGKCNCGAQSVTVNQIASTGPTETDGPHGLEAWSWGR